MNDIQYITDEPLTIEEETAVAGAENNFNNRSFITDEPLTWEEEVTVSREERNFNNRPSEDYPMILYLQRNLYNNFNRVPFNTSLNTFNIRYMYCKLRVNFDNTYCIGPDTYKKLETLVYNSYGIYPVQGSIVCTSIIILPNGSEINYYCAFRPPVWGAEFRKVANWTPHPLRTTKTAIDCPFCDSYLSRGHNRGTVCFPCYHNVTSGDVVPFIRRTGFIEDINNGIIPFVCNKPRGYFYFTGIKDTIGFKITFILETDAIRNPERSGPRFERYNPPVIPSNRRSHHRPS